MGIINKFTNGTKYLKNFITTRPLLFGPDEDNSFPYQRRAKKIYHDYVRSKSLILVANILNNEGVPGDTAEVGVFTGIYASQINFAFPTRTLHLFDTFESFNKKEYDSEIDIGYNRQKFHAVFSKTSIEMVRKKMTYPENCIFYQGLFPDTAKDLDGKFCFVSIDVDLETSIYQSLVYFYPRLEKGGYLFINYYCYSHV